MAKSKDSKKDKEKPLKVEGSFEDVIKAAVSGNPAPKKKKDEDDKEES